MNDTVFLLASFPRSVGERVRAMLTSAPGSEERKAAVFDGPETERGMARAITSVYRELRGNGYSCGMGGLDSPDSVADPDTPLGNEDKGVRG